MVLQYLYGAGEVCAASQEQVVERIKFGVLDTATTFYRQSISFGEL